MREQIPDAEHVQWLNHPTTRSEAKNLQDEIERDLKTLLGAARVSSDPVVRGYSAKYEAAQKLFKLLFQERTHDADTEE